jgi:hypothetical protein
MYAHVTFLLKECREIPSRSSDPLLVRYFLSYVSDVCWSRNMHNGTFPSKTHTNSEIKMNLTLTIFWNMALHNVVERYDVTEKPTSCIFYPENGGNRLLRNVGSFLRDCTTSYPRRQYSSHSLPWDLKSRMEILICSVRNIDLIGLRQASLAPCFMLVSCLTYFSALKMQATCSSETSVDFQQITRRYIPEDGNLPVSDSMLCSLPALYWSLACLSSQSWRWRRHVPPKHPLTFNGLHDSISLKINWWKWSIIQSAYEILST